MSNILKTLAAGSVSGEYQISRSLRFNSADSAYLSRTPASAGSLTTWTYSFWWKPCAIGASSPKLFDVGGAYVNAQSDGTLYIEAVGGVLVTSQVFRDFSAWYHIVITANSTNATSSDRLRLYVNGVRVTAFATNNQPSLDATSSWNSAVEHNISRRIAAPSNSYIDGYLTEINFIDGQALTPSSFGETNETTGVWSPIAYAGSYGTNGFYLNFSDNSDVTAATLGKDDSGNGNNWTPSGSPGFSVTAGAGNDSLVDTPTPYGDDTGAGGEVRGNYATLNPLNSNATVALSNGNLQAVANATNWFPSLGTIGMSSEKWYWEQTITSGTDAFVGLGAVGASIAAGFYPGVQSTTYSYYASNGNKYNNNSNSAYGATWTLNDVIGTAFDADAGTLTFYKNGVSQGTAFSGIPANTYLPMIAVVADTLSMNFGQRPFAHTAPSGFKALVTTNLPDPTVVQGNDYFNTVLYTGTLTTPHAISGVGFAPDFIWFKSRSQAYNNYLFNKITSGSNFLWSNAPNTEGTTGDSISFDSDGFTITAGSALNDSFGSPNNMVAWNWKADGAGSLNELGTISSTVSANTIAGISIVTWTNPASGTPTIGHGLGVAPSFIIVKDRTFAYNWDVGCDSIGWANRLNLNTTGTTSSGFWNSTAPTVSVFTYAASGGNSGDSMVAYCFAEVEGFSKFGGYTGNGNSGASGTFVYLGFRPKFFLIKCSAGGVEAWWIYDSTRDSINYLDSMLSPNQSAAETSSSAYEIDFLSNGIKIRVPYGYINGLSQSYIYAAFAENPFKYSLAR